MTRGAVGLLQVLDSKTGPGRGKKAITLTAFPRVVSFRKSHKAEISMMMNCSEVP